MYLLDTNILIYFFQGNKIVAEFLNDLCQDKFYISIITRFEVLIGAKKEKLPINKLEEYLDLCENINLDKKIVKEAINLSNQKLKFKDLLIAATAKTHKLKLITSDQDFKNLKEIGISLCNPHGSYT